MSARKTVIDNFTRLHERASIIRRYASNLQEDLFGPAPELPTTSGPETPTKPEGFFPETFSWQDRIEQEINQTGEILSAIKKRLDGEQRPAPGHMLKPKLPNDAALNEALVKSLGDNL